MEILVKEEWVQQGPNLWVLFILNYRAVVSRDTEDKPWGMAVYTDPESNDLEDLYRHGQTVFLSNAKEICESWIRAHYLQAHPS